MSAAAPEYEEWMRARDWDPRLLPDPWPAFAFGDVAGYRAFPLVSGVRSEVKFATDSSRVSALRVRAFLEHIIHRFAKLPIKEPERVAVELTLLRLAPDAFSVGARYSNPCPSAPSITTAELHRRVIVDLAYRLDRT